MSCHQCPSASTCGKKEPDINEKPLGKITAILADIGLEVTYAYDDLVFIQHAAFLLQFTDDPAVLKLFSNIECDPEEAATVTQAIIAAHAADGYTIPPAGQFTITENEDETINIESN